MSDAVRQVRRQLEGFLVDGDRNRLVVALAILDRVVECRHLGGDGDQEVQG